MEPVSKKVKKTSTQDNDFTSMNWTEVGECIDGDNEDSGRRNRAGAQPVCLSHDGNRVVIGSIYGNEGPATIKVLDFDGVMWNEVGRFSGLKRDYFGIGRALALSGDGKRLAIGAPCDRDSENRPRGHVQVYEHKEGTVWKPLGPKLIGTGNRDHNYFGCYISMSKNGNRIAVSSVRDFRVIEFDGDLKRCIVQSIVREADWGTLILEFLGENWNQVGRSLVAGTIVGCNAISADGNAVAVGFQDDDDGFSSAKVFKYSSNQGNRDWVQVGASLNMKCVDIFHKYLSINAEGNLLAVCINRGVEIFHLDGDNWKSMGRISQCGQCDSVCLAPDAYKLVVSVEDQNENSVKVFSHDGNQWILEANVMPPSGERENELSVSLSSCGEQLAVGSTITYGGVKGQVRNYKLG